VELLTLLTLHCHARSGEGKRVAPPNRVRVAGPVIGRETGERVASGMKRT